jgi:hypothetical protein
MLKIKYFVVVHLKRYFTQKANIELCMHTYSQNVNHTMGASNGIQLSDKMDWTICTQSTYNTLVLYLACIQLGKIINLAFNPRC